MAKHPDRHVPTACLCLYAPVTRQRNRAYRDAFCTSISKARTHGSGMQAAATSLRPMACQTACCRFAADGMPGCCLLPLRPGDERGRPGLQIESSQNIKAVAPESVTAFESIMDGILTRGVTDLLRQTVPVKLPADVALRQCRLCSLWYQDQSRLILHGPELVFLLVIFNKLKHELMHLFLLSLLRLDNHLLEVAEVPGYVVNV